MSFLLKSKEHSNNDVTKKPDLKLEAKKLMHLYRNIKYHFLFYAKNPLFQNKQDFHDSVKTFVETVKKYYFALAPLFNEKQLSNRAPVIIAHASRTLKKLNDIYNNCLKCIVAIIRLVKTQDINAIRPFTVVLHDHTYAFSNVQQLFDVFSVNVNQIGRIHS